MKKMTKTTRRKPRNSIDTSKSAPTDNSNDSNTTNNPINNNCNDSKKEQTPHPKITRENVLLGGQVSTYRQMIERSVLHALPAPALCLGMYRYTAKDAMLKCPNGTATLDRIFIKGDEVSIIVPSDWPLHLEKRSAAGTPVTEDEVKVWVVVRKHKSGALRLWRRDFFDVLSHMDLATQSYVVVRHSFTELCKVSRKPRVGYLGGIFHRSNNGNNNGNISGGECSPARFPEVTCARVDIGKGITVWIDLAAFPIENAELLGGFVVVAAGDGATSSSSESPTTVQPQPIDTNNGAPGDIKKARVNNPTTTSNSSKVTPPPPPPPPQITTPVAGYSVATVPSLMHTNGLEFFSSGDGGGGGCEGDDGGNEGTTANAVENACTPRPPLNDAFPIANEYPCIYPCASMQRAPISMPAANNNSIIHQQQQQQCEFFNGYYHQQQPPLPSITPPSSLECVASAQQQGAFVQNPFLPQMRFSPQPQPQPFSLQAQMCYPLAAGVDDGSCANAGGDGGECGCEEDDFGGEGEECECTGLYDDCLPRSRVFLGCDSSSEATIPTHAI